MKKLCIFFMILMLPLQSLMAEGQFFHALETGHEHSHAHGHGDAHHSHGDSDSSESDHHHHCPGHCTVLPSSLLNSVEPQLKYAEYSLEPTLNTSSPNTRIERPNWC
ncbi:conserved exported hypothetical protein [Limnobacter sp. 130]|jgi:ABC-type Zn2+ transport system substrate-binding protein/surface adhesin|uniref:hypothetical protein n=1 Tax=Limnobacter sp. 130 TaxID=2653147 RepID=UPI0012F1ED38|nr:hypothetical protein [Limnobacter sp. 130]VWX34835.1 conserved exported hypothetical protein [Limnobacter sp. 130]